MTLETHNWSSSAHQELHKIEVAKFVGDFKSLAKEADESLAKHKALELEIKRLLRAVVSQDIMSAVQKDSVVDTSNLQTELERIDNTKTRRLQPRGNTKNDRVPSASKSSRSKNKGAEVEEHHRNLLLSKNTKHMSFACNNIKLDSQNVISKVISAMCKQCLISVNHDTLVEAARTMLIFSRAPLFLWAEAIATACFTQNRFIIHLRFNKTPYELINGRKPNISFLHVFGALCYPKNDREDIGKLGAKGEPSRPVLTRIQLRSDGNMCMYALTVSTMEPKNVKEAMTDPAWIDSMQKELLQFKRLAVWVIVPAPDNISPLTLKWLFKNKHDEEQTVIQNKSRLVVRGYRQ
nr:Gag-Pol polyprotein [Tanacetum cinerariifolium]